jgi:hypothetical protein
MTGSEHALEGGGKFIMKRCVLPGEIEKGYGHGGFCRIG